MLENELNDAGGRPGDQGSTESAGPAPAAAPVDSTTTAAPGTGPAGTGPGGPGSPGTGVEPAADQAPDPATGPGGPRPSARGRGGPGRRGGRRPWCGQRCWRRS